MGMSRPLRIAMAFAGTFLVAVQARVATAQSTDSLRARYQLPPAPVHARATAIVARSAPGVSESSPSAFGASRDDGFVGLSYQASQRHGANVQDGAAFGGFGLGDPVRAVGLEVTITSYSTLRKPGTPQSGFSFLQVGGVSAMVHRRLSDRVAVALGAENAVVWGAADGGSDVYAVVSTTQPLADDPSGPLGSVTLNAGLGTGRFRPWVGDRYSGHPDNRGVGIFASGALRLASSASFIADFSGQDMAVGASWAPFPRIGLVLTPVLADVLGRANPTARFVLGVGYGFHFSQLFH